MCPTNTFTAVIAAAGYLPGWVHSNRFFLSGKKAYPVPWFSRLSEPVPFPLQSSPATWLKHLPLIWAGCPSVWSITPPIGHHRCLTRCVWAFSLSKRRRQRRSRIRFFSVRQIYRSSLPRLSPAWRGRRQISLFLSAAVGKAILFASPHPCFLRCLSMTGQTGCAGAEWAIHKAFDACGLRPWHPHGCRYNGGL